MSNEPKQILPAQVLKLLFDHLKVPVTLEALTAACEKSQNSQERTSPVKRTQFILKTLDIKGVQPAQLYWCRMDQRRLPALVFYLDKWQFVEHADDNFLKLTDAEGSEIQVSNEDLADCLVLWLSSNHLKTEKSPFKLKGNIAARLVLTEIFRSKVWLREVLIASLIINVLAISTSIFAMQVYDRVVPTLAYATLRTLVVGMIIVVCLTWLLKTLRARILDSVSSSVDKAVSQQLFDHVLGLQLDTRSRSLGTLSAQVGGLDSVRQFFTSSVIFTLIDMPFAFLFILFIYIIGGPVFWVYLLLIPIALTLSLITQKRQRELMKKQMTRSNERQGFLVDTIRGTESIRTNNASWRFSEHWQQITGSINRFNIQQKAINSFSTTSTASLANLAYVGAIVIGVTQIEAGNLTMGGLIACSILGGRVIGPITQSVNLISLWENVRQSLEMVNQILEQPSERNSEQTLLVPEETPDKIELNGVEFSYPESPVRQLKIPQLQLNSGDRIVLLGPVGSGKSTLLKVLAGLYRPSVGRVRLGNADLWEVDPSIVSNHINFLPQNVHLFKGTLKSNLDLSGVVSDSYLLEIIDELGINKIIADSPRGIDMDITEGGEGLSGGQRQLVGLARTFLAQPRIWLLDEPTASLDMDSQQEALAAIKAKIKPEDILVIATHRPGLAKQLVNRVIVMKQGEIEKDGKPENILPQLRAQPGKKQIQNLAGPKKIASR